MVKLVLMAGQSCWRSATGSCVNAHPWQGYGKSDSLTLSVSLTRLLPPSLPLSPAQCRLCAGNPSCRLLGMYLYLPLTSGTRDAPQQQQEKKKQQQWRAVGAGNASDLSQIVADWSGGSLSEEFDQNKLAWREPETHAALLADGTKKAKFKSCQVFWQQMACVLLNDCLRGGNKIDTKSLTPLVRESDLAPPWPHLDN